MSFNTAGVLTGPINARLMAGTTAVATFTGIDYDAIKYKPTEKMGSKKLSDGNTDKWLSGIEGDGTLLIDEWDQTTIEAIEAALTTIKTIELDFLNKGKTVTLLVDLVWLTMESFGYVIHWTRSVGAGATMADIMTVEATA